MVSGDRQREIYFLKLYSIVDFYLFIYFIAIYSVATLFCTDISFYLFIIIYSTWFNISQFLIACKHNTLLHFGFVMFEQTFQM